MGVNDRYLETLRDDMKEKGMDVTISWITLEGGLLGSNLPSQVSINSPPNEHDTSLTLKPVILLWDHLVEDR